MIATAIGLILLLIALNKYLHRQYVWAFVLYAFLATNGFIINLGGPFIVKLTDFSILFLAMASMVGYSRDKSFFSIKGSEGGKIVALYLGFMLLELIYSIIIDADSLSGIITCIRPSLNVFSYFVFRRAPVTELEEAIKKIFKITIFVCILFVLQFITHIELVNTYVSEWSIADGNYRMQVPPPFISYFLLYVLCFGIRTKYKWFIVALFGCVLLISQNRTPILGLVLQIGIFFLLDKNIKRKFTIAIIALLAFPIVSSMFEKRDEFSNGQSNLEVPVMDYISVGDYAGLARTSTFMFRIAATAERLNYIIEHPDKMLLGVGAIDENSSKVKQFNFYVGTAKQTDGGYEINQLDSIDVVWSPIIIRYGLLGLLLHLYIMIMSGWYFYQKRKNNNMMMLGFLIFVGALAQSFSSGGFFLGYSLSSISFLFIMLDKLQKKNISR